MYSHACIHTHIPNLLCGLRQGRNQQQKEWYSADSWQFVVVLARAF